MVKYEVINFFVELIWFDIDYMDGYRDFILYLDYYFEERVCSFVKGFYEWDQKFVMIIDLGM